jgi:hypothetical protein
MKPKLKPLDIKRLKLKYDEPLSTFALKFNLRRYMMETFVASSALDATNSPAADMTPIIGRTVGSG